MPECVTSEAGNGSAAAAPSGDAERSRARDQSGIGGQHRIRALDTIWTVSFVVIWFQFASPH